MSSVTIGLILEKISSRDKDFRYMATSDLANELEKPSFSFDSSHTEAQVTTAVLRQLEDASTDIGTLATKCLGLLVNRVSEERLRSIITTLVDGMVNGKKDHQRDVSFLGLKTIISDIDQARAATLTGAAFASLLKGLRSNTADVASNSLDSLLSIVSLHGDAVGEEERDAAREVLTLEIDASRPGIRKRAIQCLASLAPFFSDEALHDWVDGVCNRLEAGLQVQSEDKENAQATARVYVQALLSVTKSAGYRLKDQVSRALPLLFSWLERAREGSGMEVEGEGNDEDDDYSEDDLLRGGDDELLELCLSCLESLVRRSPSACRAYLMDGLVKACLQHLVYDPNYDQPAVDYGDQEYKVEGGEEEMEVDEDEDEGDGADHDGEGEGEEEDDDDDEEEEESEVDEDDTSWKVRRAAAKLAAALISQYTDMLPEVYKRLARPLVARFNEREEAVRPDIYDAYIDLLHAVAASASSSTIKLLSCDVPRVTKTLSCRMRRSHRASWAKSQGLVLRVAKELVITAPQAVARRFKDLVPGILAALQDSTGPTGGSIGPSKAEALALTNVAFSVLPPKVCAAHVPALAPLVFLAAKDKYYTVSSEALKLCEKFIPLLDSRSSGVKVDDSAAISRKVFDIVIDRLGASEVGQEVKEAAISCASVAVARLGDVMDGDAGKVKNLTESFAGMPKWNQPESHRSPKRSKTVHVNKNGKNVEIMLSIVDRMSNETTRIQAIRGLRTIADSPLDLDMTPITTKALPDLASFCRKTDRALRLESLATLAALIQREGRNMDQAALDTVLRCTAPLIKEMDTDPGCAVAALKLAETIVVRKQSWTDVSAIEEVLDAAILAIKQPSLSPGATSALESLLVGIAGLSVENSFVDNSFDTSMLMQRLAGAGTFAAAQCTAALCLASSNQHTDSQMVREITTSLLRRLNEPIGMKSTNSDAAGTTTDYVKQQRYALWSLGELGMRSAVVSKDPDVFAAVSRALTSSKSNELKPQSISPASHSALAGQEGLAVAEAAAFALGGIAAGNLEALLPLLLQQVEAQREDPKTQYQSLRALNRVIETIYRRGHTRNNNNNINDSSEVEPSSLGRPEMNDGQVNMILSLLLTLSGPGRQQKFENQGTVLKDATEDSKDKEEECRAMVAECLGRLVLIAPKVVVPAIRNDMLSQSNADPTKRAVAITALKHAVVETRGGWLESELASTLLLALGTTKRDDETDARHGDHLDQEQNQRQIQKEDLDVRKSVVVLLTAVAHNRPALVKLALDGDANPILRGLFAETKQDRSLIRTVDLGPFKHKIDDGLELRKAAFECLGVLMAKCYDRLDPGQVVEALVDGLKDAYDVKMKCHGLLATFASLAPGVVVASLDRFVDPLTQTLNAKVKADAVKQEVDRNEDMIRSCLRAVEVLSHLHGASNVPAFTHFMEQTVRGGTIGPKYAGIEAERRGLRGRTVERRRE